MKFFGAFFLLLLEIAAFAQGRLNARVQNFQANPAIEGRRFFIKGADSTNVGNGVVLLISPHVETFKLDGAQDMIIDASEAYFDQARSRDVWSDKDLATKSADGRISVKGFGFRWLAAQAQLSISNRVEATLGREALLAAGVSTNTIRVTSDQMVYTAELVVFTGNVQVVDAQGEVRCRTLRVRFGETDRPEQIEAIDDVELRQRDTIARGRRALYTPSTGLLRLSEKTSWQMADRSGVSELLIIDRTNNTFRAEMNVRMTLPSSGLINTNASKANTNKVTVSADSFDYAMTNKVTGGPIAIYNGNVHAVDPQANLDCELLTIYFNQTNRLVRAVADRTVRIERPLTSIRGEKAVFENDEVTVTGSPVWRHEEKSGASESLVFNPRTGEVRAFKVQMEIPFTSSGANSLFGAAPVTNRQPAVTITNILLVTATYFTNKEKLATFAENVRAREPRGQIDANLISVQFNATNRPTRIKAEGDVILTEAKAQALGQQADFNVETGVVRLTGVPKVMDGTNSIIAREIVLDRNTGKVRYFPPFFGELSRGTNQPAR